ncbi:MAG: hypothetical protein ACRCV0_04380 [Brevinema sp.]
MDTNTSSSATKMNIIIKGKFKFINKNIYGIFALLIDKNEKKIVNTWLFASYFQDMYDTNIYVPWTSFNDKLNQLQLTGSFAESVTISLQNAINEYLHRDKSVVNLLADDILYKDMKEIKNTVLSIFNHVEKKSAITLEVATETINVSEGQENNVNITENEPNDTEILNSMDTLSTETEDENTINQKPSIPAHPVLAPFYQSILSQKLKIGDKILMQIDESNEYGKKCAELFGAYERENNKGKLHPIIATVSKIIKKSDKTLNIVAHYNHTYYTKFNIEEGVKIKYYDSNSPEIVINPMHTSVIEEKVLNLEDASIQKLLMDPHFIKMLIIFGICLMAFILAILLL